MTDRPWLRFDHREIAVIFSLFVFVSLLMFTVGILVGKGISTARYEGTLSLDKRLSVLAPAAEPTPFREPSSGTSVTTPGTDISPSRPSAEVHKEETKQAAAAENTSAPLVLVPQKPKSTDLAGKSLHEPSASQAEAERVLNDPKLKGLIEEDPLEKRRTLAASGRVPASSSAGKFNVQVGSYPSQKDAAERVESLKKMGFSHAFFSAKELGDNKEVWFRVWLGYFPDYEAADSAGRVLVDRGEVKHYLVRNSDS